MLGDASTTLSNQLCAIGKEFLSLPEFAQHQKKKANGAGQVEWAEYTF
jgi:hypothetical protein